MYCLIPLSMLDIYRYGMLILGVVDDRKRLTYIHHGYSARSSDMRAQQASLLHTDPDQCFSAGEYVLGNSGFRCTTNVIPMYKRTKNESDLTRRQVSSYHIENQEI